MLKGLINRRPAGRKVRPGQGSKEHSAVFSDDHGDSQHDLQTHRIEQGVRKEAIRHSRQDTAYLSSLILNRMQSVNPWHFIWISVILSELFTAGANALQSHSRWGFVSPDLLLIGAVDALFVPLIVAPIAIYFILKSKELTAANELLLRESAEKIQIMASLKESECNFRSFMDNLPGVAFIKDMDGRYVFANKRYRDKFCATQDDITGKTDAELWPPETALQFIRNDRRVIEDNSLLETIETVPDDDGDHYWLSVKFPLIGKNELPSHVGGIAMDVTDFKRMEESLLESEYRFSKFFHASAAANIIVRLSDDRILAVNRAFSEMFGYEEAEIVGRTALKLDGWVSRRERRYILERLNRGLAVRDHETRLRAKSGRILDVIGFMELIELNGEKCFVATICDITERKQAEIELRDTKDRLQMLSRSLIDAQEKERRYLAGELHDEIGQELTVATLHLQNMLSLQHSLPAAQHVEQAITAVDRVIERVRGLSLDLRPSLLDDLGLVPAMRWQVDRLGRKSGSSSISFSADGISGRLPAETETACFRVAQEALTNALRHSHADEISVSLSLAGGRLMLAIRDDGAGFDVASKLRAAAGGESFGLLGMHERAKFVGGELGIVSVPGQGTEITARFPTPEER